MKFSLTHKMHVIIGKMIVTTKIGNQRISKITPIIAILYKLKTLPANQNTETSKLRKKMDLLVFGF